MRWSTTWVRLSPRSTTFRLSLSRPSRTSRRSLPRPTGHRDARCRDEAGHRDARCRDQAGHRDARCRDEAGHRDARCRDQAGLPAAQTGIGASDRPSAVVDDDTAGIDPGGCDGPAFCCVEADLSRQTLKARGTCPHSPTSAAGSARRSRTDRASRKRSHRRVSSSGRGQYDLRRLQVVVELRDGSGRRR